MHIYNKIGKHKNITYYTTQNKSNSRHCAIVADLSKLQLFWTTNLREEVVAWVDNKTKSIEYTQQYQNIIDKQYIKNFINN